MTRAVTGPSGGGAAIRITHSARSLRPMTVVVTQDQAARLRALVQAQQEARDGAPPSSPLPPAPSPVVSPASGPRHARVLAVASGKGGVGKTTLCVNLAIALTRAGWRTTLLDADLGMANADVLCGLTPIRRLDHYVVASPAPFRTIDSGVAGTPAVCPPTRTVSEGMPARACALADIAVPAPGGFRLVPGAVGVARMANLTPQEQSRLFAALAELDQTSDVIVVDLAAGLGRDVLALARASDVAVILTTPEPHAITDAYAMIKCLVGHAAPSARPGVARDLRGAASACPLRTGASASARLALVVNQTSGSGEASAVHARLAGVCRRFLACDLPLLGWITQDGHVGLAVRRRRPLLLDHPQAPAARDIARLGLRVAQELHLRQEDATCDASGCEAASSSGISGLFRRLILRHG